MMDKTALITGASAGIGYELTKIFSKNGHHLVLVARNKQRLDTIAAEMQTQHNIQAKVISKDLSKPGSPQKIYDEVVADGINVDVLVNNAGFGLNGPFTKFSAEEHMALIQVNVTAVTLLCNGRFSSRSNNERLLRIQGVCAFTF